MSRYNGRTDKWNVDEFVEELRRIVDKLLPGGDENEPVREAIQDLMQSLLIDDADCGCQVTINFKQKNVELDPCGEHNASGTVLVEEVEDVRDWIQEGKHLISCVPGDGLCRCAVGMIERVIEGSAS